MTASRRRRTRSTWLALAVTVAALIAAGILSVAGVRTLADSQAGRRAAGQRVQLPSQRLPFTPTGLVGVLDDTGRLTSLAVLAVEPARPDHPLIGHPRVVVTPHSAWYSEEAMRDL